MVISRLFFMLALVILAGCNHVKKPQNHLEEDNIKGNVKSIKMTSYGAEERFGEIATGHRSRPLQSIDDWYAKYNEQGNKIEVEYYNLLDELEYKSIYEYDGSGYYVKYKSYDSNGNVLGWLDMVNDEEGNIIEESSYSLNGDLKWKKIAKYDSNNYLIEASTYNPDGKLDNRIAIRYDDSGNAIEQDNFDSSKQLDSKFTFSYDQRNMMKESASYTSDGKKTQGVTFEFDQNGNPTEEKIYDSQGEISQQRAFKYEYDEQYNWVKRIEYYNNEPAFILYREITYYE